MPQWCVVAVLNLQSGEVEYYTLPSFKFGLASAPNQCNRASEVGMQSAMALGVCCCKFFDDFNVSGQWVLRAIMALIGLPFEVKSCFVFLRVKTDFGDGPCRTVRMRVQPDMVEQLRQTLFFSPCRTNAADLPTVDDAAQQRQRHEPHRRAERATNGGPLTYHFTHRRHDTQYRHDRLVGRLKQS